MGITTIGGLIIGLLVGVVGLAFPSDKYYPPEIVSEQEIVTLSNTLGTGGGEVVYISINSENIYSYRVELNSDIVQAGETAYEVRTIGEDEEIYVFYVPKGTISRIISLS